MIEEALAKRADDHAGSLAFARDDRVALYGSLIIKLVDLSQADSGGAIHASYNRGVVSGRESQENGRLVVVRGRQPSRHDFANIGRIRPVIVAAQQSPVAVMHVQRRIFQCARDGISIHFD